MSRCGNDIHSSTLAVQYNIIHRDKQAANNMHQPETSSAANYYSFTQTVSREQLDMVQCGWCKADLRRFSGCFVVNQFDSVTMFYGQAAELCCGLTAEIGRAHV